MMAIVVENDNGDDTTGSATTTSTYDECVSSSEIGNCCTNDECNEHHMTTTTSSLPTLGKRRCSLSSCDGMTLVAAFQSSSSSNGSSPTSSNKRVSKRRTVRFELSSTFDCYNDNSHDDHQMTKKKKKFSNTNTNTTELCHYNEHDYDGMYDEMVQHGTHLRRYHPELVKNIIRCYNKGGTKDFQEQQSVCTGLEPWVSYPLRTTPNQHQEKEEDKSSVCCRGLEYMVTRKFKRESKSSVRSTVQLYTTLNEQQQQLRENMIHSSSSTKTRNASIPSFIGQNSMDPFSKNIIEDDDDSCSHDTTTPEDDVIHDVPTLVRQYYETVSCKARVFAHQLGIADEMFVKNNDR